MVPFQHGQHYSVRAFERIEIVPVRKILAGGGRLSRHRSRPLDISVDHALFAGLVECDGEFVAVDGGDVAVAEFLVEDAVAAGVMRGAGIAGLHGIGLR